MKSYKIVVMLLMTIVGPSIANSDSVLNLTDDDFETRIRNIDATLVMFYDSWCTHCEKEILEFDKAGELLQGTKQPFTLAKVNCRESGKEICLKHELDVEVYPTTRIFRMGRLGQIYDGPENAVGIAKFMKARYGAASTELLTVTEMEEFLQIPELAIIGLFEKGSDLETFFLKFANHFKDDHRFGHSNAAEVLSKYSEKNSIVLFRAPHFHNKFESNSVTFNGDTQEELTQFLKKHRHGLVGHRKADNVEDFNHPSVVVYYAVDYVNNAKQTNYWRNRVLQVAKDHTDYRFSISSGDDFRLELEKFGNGYLGDKPFVAAYVTDNRKYKMDADFSIENLRRFVSDVKEGKLEPFRRSEKIPATNDEPVKIAVAKNFEEIVTNNGKDTFLEIYAPWCGYCKDLAPIFDELGTKMLDEDVEIVKFDGTNNEVPAEYHLQGYPTFFWLPKDSKSKPVMYNGGMELDNFIEFIAKHASNQLKNYDRNGELKKSEL